MRCTIENHSLLFRVSFEISWWTFHFTFQVQTLQRLPRDRVVVGSIPAPVSFLCFSQVLSSYISYYFFFFIQTLSVKVTSFIFAKTNIYSCFWFITKRSTQTQLISVLLIVVLESSLSLKKRKYFNLSPKSNRKIFEMQRFEPWAAEREAIQQPQFYSVLFQ